MPQWCEGLTLVILIVNWDEMNGTACKGLSNRVIINASQHELLEN